MGAILTPSPLKGCTPTEALYEKALVALTSFSVNLWLLTYGVLLGLLALGVLLGLNVLTLGKFLGL